MSGLRSTECFGGNRKRFHEQLNNLTVDYFRTNHHYKTSYKPLKRPLKRFFLFGRLFIFRIVYEPSEVLLRAYTNIIDVIIRTNATKDGCRRTTSAPS